MKKEFIPYEQALLLKKLRFDEPCVAIFGTNNELNIDNGFYKQEEYHEDTVLAPTFSQAFRWFREKYNLSTWVTSKTVDSSTIYIPCGRTIPDTTKKELVVDVVSYAAFKTYEEAELECLKKLIEIIKNK